MSDQTYSKALRLLSPGDFKPVFEQAEFRASHQHFMLLARRNGTDHPRLGLVIAKKNLKLAVQRNRIKRLVREYLRLHKAELPALDYVFLARRGLDQLDNEAFSRQLHQQFLRISKKAAQPA